MTAPLLLPNKMSFIVSAPLLKNPAVLNADNAVGKLGDLVVVGNHHQCGSPLIERIAYAKAVSYRLKNPGLERWRSDLWYMDDTALEFARYTPTTGRRPVAENEIIADTKRTPTMPEISMAGFSDNAPLW